MRRFLVLCASAFCIVTSGFAADDAPKKDLCDVLNAYTQPKNSDGAAYVAGVDVHGRSVVSADVEGGQSVVDDPVRIPIEFDLAQKYGLNLDDAISLKPELAVIEVYQDGHVVFNGKDISGQAREHCKNPLSPEIHHGQEAAHDLVSPEPQGVEIQDGKDVIQGAYPEVFPSHSAPKAQTK